MNKKYFKKLNLKARRTYNSLVETDANNPEIKWLKKGNPGFTKARYREVYTQVPNEPRPIVMIFDTAKNDMLNQVRPA